MDEKPEERGQELYNKLNSEYLIECAKNNRIHEWNAQYLEYLALEWNRLYPERTGGPIDILKLVNIESQLKRPNFTWGEFREVISFLKGAHLEGAKFSRVCLTEVKIGEIYLQGADFHKAHLEGAEFWGTYLDGAQFLDTHLEGAQLLKVHMEKIECNDTHLQGAKFYKTHLEGSFFDRVDFKEVEFYNSYLEGADFHGEDMEGVKFGGTHLKGVNFEGAQLKRANFNKAYLEGADFEGAHIEGADFTYAVVDGGTLFTNNPIDDKTDFTGTALSATRIDPNLRTRLERNVREIQWRKWYDKQKFSPLGILKKSFGKKEETKEEQESKSSMFDKLFINSFVKLFWWLSDYGMSCKRCLASFAGLIGLAFIVNFFLTQHPSLDIAELFPDIAKLFADTVLALFGVGDPGLEGIARLWQVVYVVSGYFLLAVLISRFAIMFQNTSP